MPKRYTYTLSLLSVFMATWVCNAQPQLLYITVSNKIGVIPDPENPAVVTGPYNITGMAAGQTMECIDYRPATGELYGLAYNASTQQAQLYTISQTTALATPVGAPLTLALVPGQTGFDFNPTVDRIRVVSANGSNYRINPNTGALAATDGNLAFALSDVNSAQTPSCIASAYTRSYFASEITTLYNIDLGLNILTSQTPPNAGTQNTIGSLDAAFHVGNSTTAGFDFYYDDASQTETGYVAANTNNNNDSLYTINVSTGALTNKGPIGGGIAVRDIAALITRNVPAITGVEVFAVTRLNNLLRFDSDRPQIIRSSVPVTGIASGQELLGMDFRPADGKLYAFGYDRPFNRYQLYTVDVNTGAAVAVNAAPIGIQLDTGIAAFDFNPVVDRIRLMGAGGENYRIDPNTGALAAVDQPVSFDPGDLHAGQNPFMGAAAYTNSYMGAQSTILFGYDNMVNTLVSFAVPNSGVCASLNLSGLTVGGSSLDIYYDASTHNNRRFFAANTHTSPFYRFYEITGGVFVDAGTIGYGIPVRDMAVSLGSAPVDLSITEQDVEGKVKIFPNPAPEFIRINTDNFIGKSFCIHDITGRILLHSKITQDVQTLDISAFEAGVYYLVTEDGNIIKWIKK